MTTIYLSSTYEDLKDYRSAVFEALRKAGYEVFAMEDYVATDSRPVEKCLADVARADIYVGPFAFRYGYVPPAAHGNSDSLSITEMEFRHAEKLRKLCLTFVVSDDAPWLPKFIDGIKGERINQLREYLLTEKTASFFSSPHQLATLVQAAVTSLLRNVFKASPIVSENVGSSSGTARVQRVGEGLTDSKSSGAGESVAELKPQTLSEPTQFAQRGMFGWGGPDRAGFAHRSHMHCVGVRDIRVFYIGSNWFIEPNPFIDFAD
jgi:Domain of unknown function (DUF4062)